MLIIEMFGQWKPVVLVFDIFLAPRGSVWDSVQLYNDSGKKKCCASSHATLIFH